MKAAPAVSVSIDAHRPTLAVAWVQCGLALAALAAWAYQSQRVLLSAVLAAAICVVAAQTAWAWRRRVRRYLSWDGETWSLGFGADRSAAQTGRLGIALDLDRWVLLQFRIDGPGASAWHRPQWLAIHRSQVPGQWHGLRCALYSPETPRPDRSILARG